MNTNTTKRIIAATAVTIGLTAPGAAPAQATTDNGGNGGAPGALAAVSAKRADPRSPAEITYDARTADFAVELAYLKAR